MSNRDELYHYGVKDFQPKIEIYRGLMNEKIRQQKEAYEQRKS